jgi:hypothetical protein
MRTKFEQYKNIKPFFLEESGTEIHIGKGKINPKKILLT